jgi:hypothetical protein
MLPHRAKSLQLERQVVFESVNVGRIHRQVINLDLWLSLAVVSRNREGSGSVEGNRDGSRSKPKAKRRVGESARDLQGSRDHSHC